MNRSTLLWIAVAALPCAAAEPSSTAAGTTTTMDPGLRRAFEQALYKWQPSQSGTFRGSNPAQRLTVKFDSHGVQLQHQSARVQLRLNRFGYGELSRTPVEAEPTLNGKRIEYRRGELTEWYENDSRGIEQGFTISQHPGPPRGGEPLLIELSTDGDWPLTVADSGNSVLFSSSTGAVLQYGGLRSWDARHKPVPAHLEVSGRDIRLVIDDSDAEYPLVVDPVFTQQAELTPPAVGSDLFGSAVAVSGNTAIVGAAYDEAVYVYTLNGTWALQQKLTAADGVAGENFGQSLAISGNTILVGANYHAVGSNSFQGAVYVFVNNSGSWTQQAELTASDGAAYDQFGSSVALDASTAVIGAELANSDIGAAYVFTENSGTWSQQAKLTPPDGVSGDNFGTSVAVSGSLVAVGAPYHPVTSLFITGPGAVYLFANTGASWIERAEVLDPKGASGDAFGSSVALSQFNLVVGAYGTNFLQGTVYLFDTFGNEQNQFSAVDGEPDDLFGYSVAFNGSLVVIGANGKTVGGNGGQGAVYLFTTEGIQQKVVASDGAAGDDFGFSVAASGNVIFVGAEGHNLNIGAAYVFTDAGVQDQELTIPRGEALIEFGNSVSISGNTALIGASDAFGLFEGVGAAFVFVQNDGTWTLQQTLTAVDGKVGDQFGNSVAIDGNTVVIGAFEHTVGSHVEQGTVYVFVQNGGTWTQQAELTASDGAESAIFGTSVAISGNTIIIGAPFQGGQGSAYVFVNNGSTWTQQTELTAADGASSDQFGTSVAIDGNAALVGAPYHQFQGAAYLFVLSGATWSQQAELIAADGVSQDEFGWSVAISGNNAVIGAPYKTIGANSDEGAAYVFTGLTGSVNQTRLTPADGVAGGGFGNSVALSGNTIVVGRPRSALLEAAIASISNSGLGAAYVYSLPSLALQQELFSSDEVAGDNFGYAVAADANTIVVGAPFHSIGLNLDEGTAYIFPGPAVTTTPPSIAKAFGASSISIGGAIGLTFTITNPAANAAPVTGINFADSFPSGLAVAPAPGLSNTCGGLATATAGTASVSLSGATLAVGASCTVTVSVAGVTAGVQNNSVTVMSDQGNGNTATASVTVNGAAGAPPVIAKVFGASSITLGGTTTLTFTISNPAGNPTSLTGIAFTDTFPSGLNVAASSGLTNTCGGSATTGSNFVMLSGGSLAVSGSCTVFVNVTGTATGTQSNSVTVTSAQGTGNTAMASLTVNPTTTLLSISTTSLLNGTVGASYSAQVSATGGAAPYTFSATGLTGGLTISGSGLITGTPNTAGSGNVIITVKDSSTPQNSASATLSLTIDPPLSITTTSLTIGTVGAGYSDQVTATGGAGPYTFSATGLAGGLTISGGGLITGTPNTAGSGNVIITVKDSSTPQNSASATLSLTIDPPLSITTTSLTIGTVGAGYSDQVTATGGAGPYTFSATGLAGGLTISGSGLITGTPNTAGSGNVIITVKDSSNPQNTASATLSLTINPALTITTNSLPSAIVGLAYSTQVTATGGKTPYTFSATGLPSQLTISSTGLITGTPNATSSGNVTITATDSTLPTSLTSSITLPFSVVTPGSIIVQATETVSPGNSMAFPITLGNTPSTTTFLNLASSNTNVATISPTQLTFLAGSTTPTQTPQLSGVVAGSATITATSANGVLVPATSSITVAYTANFVPTSATITGTGNQTSLVLTLSSPALSSLTFTLSSTNTGVATVPATAAIAQGNSLASIPVTSVGNGNTVIHASATGIADTTANILVQPPGTIVLNGTGTIGVNQSAPLTITVSPAPSTPLTLNLSSSDPTKVTVSPSSVTIAPGATQPSVTPQMKGVAPGSVNITASATGYLLASPLPVQVAVVSIVTASLTDGTVGLPYSATVTAGGGNSPYTFTATGLPAGLSISPSGMISGTPTAGGVSLVTITAADSTSPTPVTGSRSLTLTIQIPGDIIVPATVAVSTGNSAAYPVTLAAAPSTTMFLNLSSSNPNVVTISPTQLTFLAGSTTPTQTPQLIGAGPGSATITATSANGVLVPATSSVTVAYTANFVPTSATITGTGNQTSLVLTLSSPALSSLTFTLSSTNTGVATVPATAAIAQGNSLASIPVTSVGNGNTVIHASATGIADTTANILVQPPGTIVLNGTGTIGVNQSAPLTITVSPAPSTPLTLNLSSSDPTKVTVSPSSVTIAPGATQPSVTPQMKGVAPGSVNITASATGYLLASPLPVQVAVVSIVTASLTDGTVGLPYSATVTAGGGNSPYTFTATGLPAGLSISPSGMISGTPTAGGVSLVTITAADSTSPTPVSGSRSLSLTIQIPGDIIVPATVAVSTGNSTAYPITLATAPSTTMFLNLSSSNPNVVTVSPTQLTFLAGSTTPTQAPQLIGVGLGSAAITVTSANGVLIPATSTVTVQ